MESAEKSGNKLNGNSIRRILLAAFCVVVAACVAYVMFGVYVPNQNALGALGSVAMDIVCMIILCILVCSFAFDNYISNGTTRLFAGLLVASIWAMFLDFLNWAFDGSLEFGHLTFWFTLCSLCMGSVLACAFSLYLSSYMDEIHGFEKMRVSARFCTAFNLLSLAITFVLAITGTAFQFVDGHYEVGALYDVVTVIPILTLLYLTYLVIRYVKVIGVHDVIAVTGYICFMIAGALVETVYRIGTTYVSVAIADIFIFVMLQNEIIAKERHEVLVWKQKSNSDELTGFYNRHAYENDIKNLEMDVIADDFVYVSVDVNSLKAVNDSRGHSAGDELLIGAAECLKKCFEPYGKVYRTGGDEFIALIYVSEEQLGEIKIKIEELTQHWSGKLVDGLTLSCGYVTRMEAKDKTIIQMAILADQRMYEAKEEYYKRTGIERRRK